MGKDFPMSPFFVADLNTRGELKRITPYDYASLERIAGASDLIGRCSGELWKSPEQMEVVLSDSGGTRLRWRSTAASAGVATVRLCRGGTGIGQPVGWRPESRRRKDDFRGFTATSCA